MHVWGKFWENIHELTTACQSNSSRPFKEIVKWVGIGKKKLHMSWNEANFP